MTNLSQVFPQDDTNMLHSRQNRPEDEWLKPNALVDNNTAESVDAIFKGAGSRSRIRVRSRNNLKVLASNFQNRWQGLIHNFIGKYLCHP